MSAPTPNPEAARAALARIAPLHAEWLEAHRAVERAEEVRRIASDRITAAEVEAVQAGASWDDVAAAQAAARAAVREQATVQAG